MGDSNDTKMKEYMAQAHADHVALVVLPRIEDNVAFEIKSHILKDLTETPLIVKKDEDANGHIEKVLEISDILMSF